VENSIVKQPELIDCEEYEVRYKRRDPKHLCPCGCEDYQEIITGDPYRFYIVRIAWCYIRDREENDDYTNRIPEEIRNDT